MLKNLVILALLLSPFANAYEAKNRITYPSHIPQVVHLTMIPSGGGCTGFVIKKNVIATAAHCVEGETSALVLFTSGHLKKFKVYAHGLNTSAANDWGLLVGDTTGVEPLNFPAHPPALPLATFSVGYGMHGPQSIVPGAVLQIIPGPELILINDVDHGDSGGPVMGYNNTVIGIVVELFAESTGGKAVPYTVLQDALLNTGL